MTALRTAVSSALGGRRPSRQLRFNSDKAVAFPCCKINLYLIPPKTLEPRRRQLGVAHRVLDRLVAQIALDRARIDALIGQLVTTSMAQHVRVDFHVEARSLSRALHHRLKTPRRKRCPTLAHKDEVRSCRLPFQPAQGAQLTPGQGVRCRGALFDSADVQDAAF